MTLPGGHRVGLVGEAWFTEGELRGFKHIASLNIRLARAVPGVAKPFFAIYCGRWSGFAHFAGRAAGRGQNHFVA